MTRTSVSWRWMMVLTLVLGACSDDRRSPTRRPTPRDATTSNPDGSSGVDGGPRPGSDGGPTIDGGPALDGGQTGRTDGGSVGDGGPGPGDDGGLASDGGPVTGPDGGPVTGPDGGPVTGPDGGRPDAGPTGPCPPGTEGCACTSTVDLANPVFPLPQDNCDPGLICVPWDGIFGDPAVLLPNQPYQTCVRPCMVDADCGANRTCASTPLIDTTGAASICTDTQADIDRACGFGRLTTAAVAQRDAQGNPTNIPVTLQTPGDQVGCVDGLQCLVGFFGDLNVDEGICGATCNADADCPTQYPHCNPNIFTGIGLCTDYSRGVGAICGSDDPDQLFLSTRCDTSPSAPANLTCILLAAGASWGSCVLPCTQNTTCQLATSATGLPLQCTPGFFDPANPPPGGDGICHEACNDFPDTCPGNGWAGLGSTCLSLDIPGAATFGLCQDLAGPALTPGRVENGTVDPAVGDDCSDAPNFPNPDLQFLRCPDQTSCQSAAPNGARCLYNCNPTAGAGFCQGVLGNQNVSCLPLPNETTEGICSFNVP